jgi:hypothetical protein
MDAVIKTPLIQKTAGRKAEPPMNLPSSLMVDEEQREEELPDLFKDDIEKKETSEEDEGKDSGEEAKKASNIPSNLPFI